MVDSKETQTMQSRAELSWKQTAQYELFHGWQRWVSFTCIWIWSCITTGIAASNDVLQRLTGVLSAPNEITLIACAAVLMIILVLSGRIPSVVDSRRIVAFAGALLVVGSVAYLFGVISSYNWPFIIGMIAGGANIAILKIAWGEMYSRMGLRQGLISMGYALVASTLVVLLTRDLTQIYLAGILVLVAIPCAPLAYLGTHKLQNDFTDPTLSKKPVRFSVSLLLLPAMVALSFGIVKGMMPWLAGAESTSAVTSNLYAELIVGIALLVFSYKLSPRFGAAQIYAFALIFVVGGLILFSVQGVTEWYAFFVHNIGFALFYFFMVVYWGDLSRRTGMSIVRIYTIGYGTFQLVQIIGSLLGYYLVGNPAENHALIIFLIVVLAFFVVVLLLLSNSHSSLREWLLADEPAAEFGDEIPVACTELSAEYSLSPREHEVFSLLARGRNASYIARTLCISLDTSKTHIKNIYRKLDVHTHQELIDKIEKTIASSK